MVRRHDATGTVKFGLQHEHSVAQYERSVAQYEHSVARYECGAVRV